MVVFVIGSATAVCSSVQRRKPSLGKSHRQRPAAQGSQVLVAAQSRALLHLDLKRFAGKESSAHSMAPMSASVRAPRCPVDAMQRASRPRVVAQLMEAAMSEVMRHNRATHTDARASAAIWTRRQARAGGCER